MSPELSSQGVEGMSGDPYKDWYEEIVKKQGIKKGSVVELSGQDNGSFRFRLTEVKGGFVSFDEKATQDSDGNWNTVKGDNTISWNRVEDIINVTRFKEYDGQEVSVETKNGSKYRGILSLETHTDPTKETVGLDLTDESGNKTGQGSNPIYSNSIESIKLIER
ncbi:MAG: hypothetical protein UR93_C0028G0004 [Berkelbacteria bacterium GW2011_GWA2_35_9]|uniref:Uncharacterized protein n=1 Tax=Berkelbacteria bacterium GW2011_GWA2_35_9 TaxID=1618333 RepID=A0A0G0G858_9BACT|nr:MAG: hypothetical protein UR93_C0028G0004 [Berkelbacteria bacterium GW2011_GWA2_35_9]